MHSSQKVPRKKRRDAEQFYKGAFNAADDSILLRNLGKMASILGLVLAHINHDLLY
jgi:hypothetical protein